MKVDGCYAKSTNECEGELTKEHIISKALLGATMTVTINGKETVFAKKNFVVCNLCRHHNNSFRRMEAHMKHFMDFIAADANSYQKIRSSLTSELGDPTVFKIKGRYLENWLVKTAINYRYLINNFEEPDFNFKYISRRLFGEAEFLEPYGLSLLISEEHTTHKYPGIIFFEPQLDEDGEVMAVCMNLQCYFFLMWLPTKNSHELPRRGIVFDGKHYEYDKFIHWHGGGIRQQMLAKDDSLITRSELRIKWQ